MEVSGFFLLYNIESVGDADTGGQGVSWGSSPSHDLIGIHVYCIGDGDTGGQGVSWGPSPSHDQIDLYIWIHVVRMRMNNRNV